jgi:tetratricopeptide (TPR) repeat protein
VYLEEDLDQDASEDERKVAREAATALLSLPWELLHDGGRFLFQGARPVRVRRRLPNTRVLEIAAAAPPIRILLVTARPEDDACLYIDHRASAKPLVQAMENLGGLVRLSLLDPPTFPALLDELDRARQAGRPYHVVHFDGHGVYSRTEGLGGLCFERPEDVDQLVERRHETVYTDKLGPALADYRIPLVFLEACQTAQADEAAGSVASALLQAGVASVVAMSHSVLVETAWRFVEEFYQALADGARVGQAMLAGQRRLHDDTFRLHIFGAGELHLQDWFVPVLFQEKEDPQLFRRVPSRAAASITEELRRARCGKLPEEPTTGFIGRSRELLALQRLLRPQHSVGRIASPSYSAADLPRWAVVRGNGGEGKTALAVELARWLVRSQQMDRAAFVSVEIDTNAAAVVNALGRQLAANHPLATEDNLDAAVQQVERALEEQSTVLVMDNMESLLRPPYATEDETLAADAANNLREILALCQRLCRVGGTRVVFTSREALPEPFADQRHRIELTRLAKEDAVKLVERALQQSGVGGRIEDATREAIEDLVVAVQCHARTLALLAQPLRELGTERTRQSLVSLMEDMHRRFPKSREQSLFASVELSLQRLSAENRKRVRVLGVFHGGVTLGLLQLMMKWEQDDVATLAIELIQTGLATPAPYNHLRLDPALCPYLRARLLPDQRQELETRWVEAMRAFARFLSQQQSQDIQLAATLTLLELPNLMALLDRVSAAGDPVATIDLATDLFRLLQPLGKPRLLEKVGAVRDAAAKLLGEHWSHAQFESQRTHIEQLLGAGQLREALEGASQLHQCSLAAGESAHAEADYDIAGSCWLLGRVLKTGGAAAQALLLLQDAERRFDAVERREPSYGAAGMTSASLTEQGDCLRALGRLDEAAEAYEDAIRRAEASKNARTVAVARGQLAEVRLLQHRYPEALAAYEEVRKTFEQLGEPATVASCWHQIGRVYQEAGEAEEAERSYCESLAVSVRLGYVAGQADTLGQLGNLYKDVLGRLEEAAAFYRQSADKYVQIGDMEREGRSHGNLADALCSLSRYAEAREQARHAIACREPFGHAAEPWNAWAILAEIERADGQPEAAATARRKAIDLFLIYRRDGGENYKVGGRLCAAVTEAMLAGNVQEVADMLAYLRSQPTLSAQVPPLLDALEAILGGRRDPSLAQHPDLWYTDAAEILLLLEALARAGH